MKPYTCRTLAILLAVGCLILTGALNAPYGPANSPAWAAESASPATPAPPPPTAPPAPPAKTAPAQVPRKAAPDIQYEKSMEPELPARKLPKAGVTEIRRGPEVSD